VCNDFPLPSEPKTNAARAACAPRKDVIMRPTTTTALALAGTALALPAGVALAASDHQPNPTHTALAAPFAGHLNVNARMMAERREAVAERYVPRIVRFERRTAHTRDGKFRASRVRHRLEGASIGELRVELRRSRRELRRTKAAAASAPAATGTTASPNLQAIAACESGGNPGAVDSSGTYRGKYQFDYSTWQSVGGTGDPAAASEAEQDQRAAMLYSQQGATPWPVCGR
jgi:Transglycosylase-like domain